MMKQVKLVGDRQHRAYRCFHGARQTTTTTTTSSSSTTRPTRARSAARGGLLTFRGTRWHRRRRGSFLPCVGAQYETGEGNGGEEEDKNKNRTADSNASSSSSSQLRRSLEFWSVVVPTYNRLPILTQCLEALESQDLSGCHGKDHEDGRTCRLAGYEVVLVDDGSTDDTVPHVLEKLKRKEYKHLRLVQQKKNQGAAVARNAGVRAAKGGVIVFIDSDMVVSDQFLKCHASALYRSMERHGDLKSFTYGSVINTNNFKSPRSEPHKLSDYSAAFFATGNVAIPFETLMEASPQTPSPPPISGTSTRTGPFCVGLHREKVDVAVAVDVDVDVDGPFDVNFSTYGWEDLELGERLKQLGCRLVAAPEAKGYHWHPKFMLRDLPALLLQERQRGRNGIQFFRKHPNLRVRKE